MSAASSSIDAPAAVAAPQQRRISLRVSSDAYIGCVLRIHDPDVKGWFDAAALEELLELLHAMLPAILPGVLEQRTPARASPDPLEGDTLNCSLVFQPTASARWLLHDAAALQSVAYTLLLDVEERPA